MGALVPPEDLPEPQQPPRLVPADDLPGPAKPKLSGWDKAVNMIGRGAWALPGLVGLDHETVQAWATGTPKEKQLEISRQVDAENPITSGLVRGAAAAPGEALAWMAAPEVKLAQGAGALTKALSYGPRAGVLAGASEYGSTAHKDPLDRAAGAGVAGAAGTVLGGGMAAGLPNPAVLGPARPTFDPAAAELAAARAEGQSLAASRAAAGADALAQGGDAAAQNASTLVVKPSRSRIVPRALQEPEPIPEARYLMDRGVPLTGGLRDPNSAYGHTEIASQSVGVVGPGIRNQRTKALDEAMHLAFEEARPPGSPSIGKAGDINDKYGRLKSAWDAAYDAIRAKDELVQPSILEGEFGRPLRTAGDAPGVIDQIIDDTLDPLAASWDDASRVQARKFLDNQFTRLNAARRDPAGRVPLGDMLKLLSDVREFGRAAVRKENHDLGQIAGRVSDAIEQAIETQASPATSQELRALNAGYRNFKVVEDAVIRAKDAPGGISPAQLSMAVRGAESSRSRYAAGGGGPIRDLSKAVRTVFDESGAPPNGARLLSVAPEWLNRWATAPTIYLRNASSASASGGKAGARAAAAAKAAAKAQTKAAASQQIDPNLLEEFFAGYPLNRSSPSALALSAAMQGRLGLRLPPATAGDDR